LIKSLQLFVEMQHTVWTIGHSTHPLEQFIAMLHSFQIAMLVDIRNYPGSRRYPYFNKEALEISLPANGIRYKHLKELGGRRPPLKNSVNTAWRNDAFRGYADYVQTNEFKNAIEKLQVIAQEQRTAYMCSEAVWWRCHRSLVSDFLKWKGWKVMHIMDIGKTTEHPYTKPARIVDGVLRYDEPDLFNE
jgi:uncharacterized protein (DUF488 family)